MSGQGELTEVERNRRVRRLVALEINRILLDLDERLEWAVSIWSRLRAREPFLDSLFSRWRTLPMEALLGFDEHQIGLVDGFYQVLDDTRLYLSWTEDMPRTLEDRVLRFQKELHLRGELAIGSLGGAPVRPRALLGPLVTEE